jgi:hypothetical protein
MHFDSLKVLRCVALLHSSLTEDMVEELDFDGCFYHNRRYQHCMF